MNTRKLFFGFLAVAFLAMTAVITITVDSQDTGIKKNIVIKKK